MKIFLLKEMKKNPLGNFTHQIFKEKKKRNIPKFFYQHLLL